MRWSKVARAERRVLVALGTAAAVGAGSVMLGVPAGAEGMGGGGSLTVGVEDRADPSSGLDVGEATPTPPSLDLGEASAESLFGTAYETALHNLLVTNTVPADAEHEQTGLLEGDPPMMLRAGGGYDQPWTRDASVNSWNAASLLDPSLARNTLWAVAERQSDGKLILDQDNQWWDQVVWVTAAWNHYVVTGDREFLADAYETTQNTIARREAENYNARYGLFEGPAFFNDGIAGYPTPPADPRDSRGSFVLDYPGADELMVLSTNELYFSAYQSAELMARALGQPAPETDDYARKASSMKNSINERFWMPEEGTYGYFLHGENSDHPGMLDEHQEGAGLSFAILFGIADDAQAQSIMRTTDVQTWGITDVYPTFPRYSQDKPGRHNRIVWPMIQGYWASAAARVGAQDTFATEVARLAKLANNNSDFWEIYNADSGAVDGGYQSGPDSHWDSAPEQTWSATAYLRMIYDGVFGMRLQEDGIRFAPTLPAGWGDATLRGLRYRDAELTVRLHGAGSTIRSVEVDGKRVRGHDALLPDTLTGPHTVDIRLSGWDVADRDADGVRDTSDACPDVAGTSRRPLGCPDLQRLEAEDAHNTGGTKVNTNHLDYSGRGFVDGTYSVGATTTFTTTGPVNINRADLTIRYANGYSTPRTMSLYVNGTRSQQVSFPPTGGWDSWATMTLPNVVLRDFSPSVALRVDEGDDGRVNLDWLAVNRAARGGTTER